MNDLEQMLRDALHDAPPVTPMTPDPVMLIVAVLSMVPGTSNSRVSFSGLPHCRDSARANSSARSARTIREYPKKSRRFTRLF